MASNAAGGSTGVSDLAAVPASSSPNQPSACTPVTGSGVSRSSGWLAASASTSAAVLASAGAAPEELQATPQLLGVDGDPLPA